MIPTIITAIWIRRHSKPRPITGGLYSYSTEQVTFPTLDEFVHPQPYEYSH